jgi:hypothetical protein
MTIKTKSYKKQIADAVIVLLQDIQTYQDSGSVMIKNRTFYSVDDIINAHAPNFEEINTNFNRTDFNVNSLYTIANAISDHYEGSYC